MLGQIATIVEQFKQNWEEEIAEEAIRSAMTEAGHKWRKRTLDPVTTFRLFTLQILFGNLASNFVPRLGGKKATGSAYCDARSRLPLASADDGAPLPLAPSSPQISTRITVKVEENLTE